MAVNYRVPTFPTNLPWFMFDLRNKVLITSYTIPGDISDTKEIVLTETPIPGLNFQPISTGGGGNRKISFSIPIVKRNNTVGNTLQRAAFENLRNKGFFPTTTTNVNSNEFAPTPKVLYQYGVGIPLVYFVKKCDFVHKGGWQNELGNSTYTEVQIELWLDETDPLYKMEEQYRRLAAYAGAAIQAYDVVAAQTLKQRPF